MTKVQVALCRPLDHQRPAFQHPARYQLRNWGRRTGKDTLAFTEANVGRGPSECTHAIGHCQRHFTGNRTCWAGLRDGLDVIWLAPAHPQADLLWLEQIVPRCSNPAYEIHTAERRVKLIGGGGSLWVKSAADHDTVNTIRGMGSRLGGVIINEAAHLDLQYALTNVIGAATVDRNAWVTIQSTPIRGSYFNTLCRNAKADTKPDWFYTHSTFRQNDALPPTAEASLAALIMPGTDAWREEVEAELLTGGGGMVCPMFDARVHKTHRDVPRGWRWAAGMDWGTRSPGCVLIGAAGPEDTIIRYEFTFQEEPARKVGYRLGMLLRKIPEVEYIAGDTNMWEMEPGAPTIAERVQEGINEAMGDATVVLYKAQKGKGSVASGIELLHEQMIWSGDPDHLQPWQRPRLTIHEGCVNLLKTLPSLELGDPKPGKSVWVKDGQPDHWFDALRYYLMSRPPEQERIIEEVVPQDRHPGFDRKLRRKPQVRTVGAPMPWDEEVERGNLYGFHYDTSPEGRGLVEYDGD